MPHPPLWSVVTGGIRGNSVLHLPRLGQRVPLPDLLARAERTAGQLVTELGGRVPERVGVLMANGEPWVRAALAVLRLDATLVPLPLPVAFGGSDTYADHIHRLARDAALDAVLVDGDLARRTVGRLATGLPLVDVGQPSSAAPPDFAADERPGTRPAVIQYTSGSTSRPRGVVLTAANVAACLATMTEQTRLTRSDVLGLWLPLFHDMGLFSLLGTVSFGASVALWRPADFVRGPMRWLAEFCATGCTGLPAPNFFFDHLVEGAGRDGVPAGVELSAWRFAIDGAEPVQARTIEALHRTFAGHGLRPDLVHPAYGLAEATLMVTFPELHAPIRTRRLDRDRLGAGARVRPVGPDDPQGRVVVSCGRPVPGMALRIADPSGIPYPDGTVGEIQLCGPAVSGGYLDVDARHQPYTADGWLRTGDLAFVDSGEVYVVGRRADVIIVRGQNYYAEDVEEIVRTTPGIDRRVCTAFAWQAGTDERMVVLWETRLDPEHATALADDIRTRLREQLGLGSTQVVAIPPSTIPHTTSGKVRRFAARRLYDGHLPRESATSAKGPQR